MRADVESWFRRRTSSAEDWQLADLQKSKATTAVSVVLPALDEESTVGPIVAAIRDGLVDVVDPLVDELVVVDSGSTDRTPTVAADAGARVVHREDVLPDVPPLPGKGEAMWRGLAATTGDAVVYLDSDLEEFDIRFVTGLLGPLLTDPDVHLVKATYDRPLRSGETVLPAGGGRVTEIVARPLLNLGWPELAGFVQPLSGEYAGRRRLLERIPFPTGYGVELAILIDALRLVGLDGLAQVDVTNRKHRNSDDAKLGQMASEIIAVALERLHREGRLPAMPALSYDLTQFARDGASYRISTTTLTPRERPPLADIEPGTADLRS